MISVNKDYYIVSVVERALIKNGLHCPRKPKSSETLCPCTDFLNQKEEGTCLCGFFYNDGKLNEQ